MKSHADPARLLHPTTQNTGIWYYSLTNHAWRIKTDSPPPSVLPELKAVILRLRSFQGVSILISFDVVIAGKKNPPEKREIETYRCSY